MFKIFWEEATKRESRIASIILLPLSLIALIILAIGYKIFLEYSDALNTYVAVYRRCINENNIS